MVFELNPRQGCMFLPETNRLHLKRFGGHPKNPFHHLPTHQCCSGMLYSVALSLRLQLHVPTGDPGELKEGVICTNLSISSSMRKQTGRSGPQI